MPGSILVVDDEANLRQTLALILRRAGNTVSVAANVDEAWQQLQAGAFDLALLDLKMPGTNGLDVLPELRQAYPHMLVMILTAHDRRESALEAIHKGARDFLLKPIDPDVMISRVEEVLADRDQPPSLRRLDSQIRGLFSGQEGKEE